MFAEFLSAHPDIATEVAAITKKHRAESAKPVYTDSANKAAKMAIFGQLGGIKLKKTVVAEKTMFAKSEGAVTAKTSGKDAAQDGRRALSKLVDFPGDQEEIAKHLADPGSVDPAGADASVRRFARTHHS